MKKDRGNAGPGCGGAKIIDLAQHSKRERARKQRRAVALGRTLYRLNPAVALAWLATGEEMVRQKEEAMMKEGDRRQRGKGRRKSATVASFPERVYRPNLALALEIVGKDKGIGALVAIAKAGLCGAEIVHDRDGDTPDACQKIADAFGIAFVAIATILGIPHGTIDQGGVA